ncbi:hypothetical protein BT69DRAFT_1235836 [Atractiella rhizophila]|nr:hypothetical protein BT69DRAFT_1235836 [Atractiella rhizophila]
MGRTDSAFKKKGKGKLQPSSQGESSKDHHEAGHGKLPRKIRRKLYLDSLKSSSASTSSGTSSTVNSKSKSNSKLLPKVTRSDGSTAHSRLISSYHALLKKLSSPSLSPGERVKLKRELEALGGVKAYQEASTKGGRGEEGDGWLIRYLTAQQQAHEVELERGMGIRVLDVGSILGTSYKGRKARRLGIKADYIDLHPAPDSTEVVQADFLTFSPPLDVSEDSEGGYDIVSLSLVLNFVGSLSDRSKMLLRAHSFLRPTSPYRLLYLVLPTPCLSNSRYMDHSRMRGIVEACNYEVVKQEESKGGKLSYWLLRWNTVFGVKTGEEGRWKRVEVRGGVDRNNFCIVL